MKRKVLFFVLLLFNNALSDGLYDVYSQFGFVVIAAGSNGVTLRSKNGGTTYSRIIAGSQDLNSVYMVGPNVWTAGDNGACYKSLDTGSTWAPSPTGTTNNLKSICFIDSLTGFIVGENGTLLKTVNGGNSWSILNSGTAVMLNRIRFANMNTGFICGNNGTFLKTTNTGTNWNIVTIPVTLDITTFDVSGNFIIAGTGISEIIRSTDLGSSWLINKFNIYSNPGITSAGIQDSVTAFISFESGAIWYTQNSGAAFSYSITTILDEIHSLSINGQRGYAVSGNHFVIERKLSSLSSWTFPANVTFTIDFETVLEPEGQSYNRILEMNYQKRGTLYALQKNILMRSMDFGENWLPVSTLPDGNAAQQLLVSMKDSSKMIAILNSNTPAAVGNVYRTVDYGSNWNLVYSGSWDVIGNLITQDPLHPDTLYLGIRDSVIRSTNFGLTWTTIARSQFMDWCDIAVSHSNSNLLYGSVHHYPARLIKSTDGGFNWVNIDLVFDTNYSEMPAIAVTGLNGNIVYHAQQSSASFQNGLKRSYSQGNSWLFDLFTGASWAIDISRDNPFLYAYGSVGTGQPIYISTNGGINYINSPDNWAEQLLFYDNANLFSTDHSEIYKMRVTYDMPVIGINKISSEIPAEFNLYQNYPNPFNPVTKIKFEVPNRSNSEVQGVSLVIFDILGREVETLVNENLQPGTYEAEWNANGYSSGMYFYVLKAGNKFYYSKKMVLLK